LSDGPQWNCGQCGDCNPVGHIARWHARQSTYLLAWRYSRITQNTFRDGSRPGVAQLRSTPRRFSRRMAARR
ncbi:MAG: hypothetical protein WCD68_13035, partial [Candidatus Acidiferrum sp.]